MLSNTASALCIAASETRHSHLGDNSANVLADIGLF